MAIMPRMRVLFFGLPAGVSADVLAGLLAERVDVAGVVVPAPSVPHLLPASAAPFAVVDPPPSQALPLDGDKLPAFTLSLAWALRLPLFAARELAHPETLAALGALAADVAVVACYTQRIPATLLAVPPHGFLNLHPSLLPDFRGPVPVFWQMRAGAPTGVTLHVMDEGLDTGDIVAQTAVPLPDGISDIEANWTLMRAGLPLLRDALAQLTRGALPRTPQQGGSHQGFPTAADYALSTEWPARRAFNFMRVTSLHGMTYPVEVAGRTLELTLAEHYEPDLELDRLTVRHGRNVLIRFNPGILYARAVR